MHSPGPNQVPQSCLPGCCSGPDNGEQPPIPRRRSTSAACRHDFTAATTSSLFPNASFTNHESIPSLQESFVQFIKAYPKYSDTAPVDQIRAREYGQLSLAGHVSLDYIGVGLFSQSQVKSTIPASQKPEFPLLGVTFKSVSLKSQLLHGGDGPDLESAIRKRIMEFLNISPTEYSMVFTANRSSAFKLVAESYPFENSRKLLTVYDHQSEAVDAMTGASEKRGARVMAAEFKWPRLRIQSAKLRQMIVRKKKKKKGHRGLFVFPLQSRMTGASYSYQWMALAQEHGWHVLLDACALSPKDMASFGLSLLRPDFLICSFYKVFGENPTGFGCLFVKKSVVPILEGSASVGIVSITPAKKFLNFPEDSSGTDTELEQMVAKFQINENIDHHDSSLEQSTSMKLPEPPKSDSQIVLFQGGNKLNQDSGSIIQCRCLDHVDSLGLLLINSRGRYLINWLITAMMKLQHPNRLDNFPLVTIYGPKVKFERGPALAFNIYDWKGEKVEPALVQKLADRANISLSHGFLHHIWFPEKGGEEKQRTLERNMKENEMRSKSKKADADQGITVVTAALTFLADFEDVYRLWQFIAQFLDADFVEKERWRYTALNQKTIEV